MKKLLIVVMTIVFSLLASSSFAEEYIVKKGDCLGKIGNQFGVAYGKIAKANNIKPPYTIFPGQTLTVPTVRKKTVTLISYKVKRLKAEVVALEKELKARKDARLTSIKKAIKATDTEEEVTAPVAKKEETKTTKVIVTTSEQGKTANVKTEVVATTVVTTAVKDGFTGGSKDVFDLMMHGTYYKTANGTDGSGTSVGGRMRFRPDVFYFSNVGGSDYNLGIGLHAYGSMVDGKAGKNSDAYHNRTLIAGPTAKLYGKGWDANFDLGFGLVNQAGKGYDENQTAAAPFIWYSNYARRIANNPWFAKTEIGLGMIIPIGAKSSRDMNTAELSLVQWIYDKKIKEDIRLSVGVEAGIGYSKSSSATDFYRLGPALSLNYKTQNVVTLSAGYKNKVSSDGDLWLINVSTNVGNIIKLVKASRITEPKAADLTISK